MQGQDGAQWINPTLLNSRFEVSSAEEGQHAGGGDGDDDTGHALAVGEVWKLTTAGFQSDCSFPAMSLPSTPINLAIVSCPLWEGSVWEACCC